jgi:transposase, IS5 family
MKNLIDFALKEKYSKVKELRSRLEDMKKILDWESFLVLFPDKETNRGRPPYEKILMIKVMFLQSWYSISDEELEYQMYNRLDFQQFLDFPESIPDYSTIWRFREELAEADIIDKVWEELKRQIKEHNIQIKEGKIQDASFIEADPGKKNSGMNGRGREAKTSRSKDGSWTKKGKKSIFGFKSHLKVDDESKIITEVGVTTAKTYDGNIDLADKNDVIYRDKGYTGRGTRAKGNGSMKRGNLSPKEWLRNNRISKKRCRGEHPLGTMHRSFNAGRTKLTTLGRVFVQRVMVCAAYNLHRLHFLLKKLSGSSH